MDIEAMILELREGWRVEIESLHVDEHDNRWKVTIRAKRHESPPHVYIGPRLHTIVQAAWAGHPSGEWSTEGVYRRYNNVCQF